MNPKANETANQAEVAVALRQAIARRMPWWTQWFFTWLMGLALPGQRPLIEMTAAAHVLLSYLALFGGAALSVWFLGHWPPGLVGSWILTVYGARKAQVQINHQITHERLTGIGWLDRLIGELNSIILVIQAFHEYLKDHVRIHHTRAIASALDPDAAFLVQLGFRPGIPARRLSRRLMPSMISPRFHWLFILARVRSCFGTGAFWRRISVALLWTAILISVASVHAWLSFAVAWVVPVGLLYQSAALAQFATEHIWLRPRLPGESARDRLAGVLIIRLLGDAPVPEGLALGRALLGWARWFVRLIVVHVPIRLCVWGADLTVHGWHHETPRSREWPNAIYAFSSDFYARGFGRQPYAVAIGFGEAVELVMSGISAGTLEPVSEAHPQTKES